MRKEKQLLLNEIKEKIDASTSMIVTSYQKLSPNVSWQLRERLAQSGSVFEVVRKRMFLMAAKQANIPLDPSLLEGHVGVVFVNQLDSMPSTKWLFKFSEENGKILHVLYGWIEGKPVPQEDLEMLSKLPDINEMRSSLLALFVSPMSQMLAVLEAAMTKSSSVVEQENN